MKNKRFGYRPILPVEFSVLERILDIFAICGLIFGLGELAYSWAALPSTIPIHFDFAGKPNNYANKVSLWMFPLLSLLLFITMTVIRRYPHTFNYPFLITHDNALSQYKIARLLISSLKAEVVWIFSISEWISIHAALSKEANINLFGIVLPLILVVFVTVGAYFWKAYQAR